MKKRITVTILLAILISFSPLYAQQRSGGESTILGIIGYMDGEVDVFRDGEYIPWQQVTIGLKMEKYDLMETDTGSYAEVELDSPISSGTLLKINENTAFYFDFNQQSGRKQANVNLLAGSLGMKVQKLTGTGEVTVSTESAVMGVRGTDFRVTTAPDGSILVTCVEGEVACRNKKGEQFSAKPGQAVEQEQDEELRSLFIDAADIETFEKQWLDQKIEAFLAGSLGALKRYVPTYNEYKKRFNDAYADLMEYNGVFQRWEQYSAGEGPDMGSAVKDKVAVSTAVFKMRSIMFLFEHVFYRIWGISGLYDAGRVETGRLWSGYTTEDFFRDFKREEKNLSWKMAQVRHVFKLYSKMSWDISPEGDISPGGGSLMDDIFSGDNPLDNDGFFDDF
jgi:hypothetical protein